MCILRYSIGLASLAVATGFIFNHNRPRLTSNTFLGNTRSWQPLASSAALEDDVDTNINGASESALIGTNQSAKREKKLAVLLCPAQFCVPVDYENLLDTIQEQANVNVVATRVAPLPRTEWIKVAKQLPTKNFLDANLSVKVTLDWYFTAMESALTELFAEGGEDLEVCIIGHSIGGWVARAYLGGLSGSSTAVYRLGKERIKSLITIGTPHISPESALVDQTRGLLREIASSEDCSSQSLSERGVTVTCVGSSSLPGKLITTDVEEIIAATSYLPLVGRLGADVKGDGIVPTELAFMESPARRVEIDKCSESGNAVRHAHVLPTPWNLIDGSAASIKLPEDIVWYGSPGVLSQWLQYIE
jgi:pimeloyl-ACP methyl ester carboxylesterase